MPSKEVTPTASLPTKGLPPIPRFTGDRWKLVVPAKLKRNDEVLVKDETGRPMTVIVSKATPGRIWLQPSPIYEAPIKLQLFDQPGEEALGEVLDGLKLGVYDYGDGTFQIRDDEGAPGQVFSPRLDYPALAAFAAEQLSRYRDWIASHEEALERVFENGERYPRFERWWASGSPP